MGFLRALTASLAVRAGFFIRRGFLLLTVYLLAFLLLVGGVFLLLFGFYLWSLERFGNPSALLITASLCLLLALTLLLGWLLAGRLRQPARIADEQSAADIQRLETDVDRLSRDLDRLVRRHAPSLAVGAFLAGLAVGISPRIRQVILRWLR